MAKFAVGVKVACDPLTATVPVAPLTRKWLSSQEAVSIGSENVATMGMLSATLTAPEAGEIPVTVGGVVSLGAGGSAGLSLPPQPMTTVVITTAAIIATNGRKDRERAHRIRFPRPSLNPVGVPWRFMFIPHSLQDVAASVLM